MLYNTAPQGCSLLIHLNSPNRFTQVIKPKEQLKTNHPIKQEQETTLILWIQLQSNTSEGISYSSQPRGFISVTASTKWFMIWNERQYLCFKVDSNYNISWMTWGLFITFATKKMNKLHGHPHSISLICLLGVSRNVYVLEQFTERLSTKGTGSPVTVFPLLLCIFSDYHV